MSDSTGLSSRVQGAVRELSPGYFAMVMATGIVSTGLQQDGFQIASEVLLVVTALSFVLLLALTLWRLLADRHEFVDDFTHPQRGFGFYTSVAAANVLGARIAAQHLHAATVLLGVSAVAWLFRGYAVPWSTRLGRGEHPIVAAANGTWFMWAVSGQSIAVAAATIEALRPSPGLALLAVVAWSLGIFLYVVDGVFVAMRLLAYDFGAEDLTPPYWVAMGAAAITVLAGASILKMSPEPALASVRELVRGASVVAWTIAAWLLPGLFAMGWWRHVTHRVPLRYDASLWTIVFPLGMYALASRTLAHADHLPFLDTAGSIVEVLAVIAWVVATGWMLWHILTTVLLPERA